MTLPRRHVPGQFVMLTRRTVDRRYFLRPDSHNNRVVMYEVAKASVEHDVPISGLMVQSNHPHIVGADPLAQRSFFMRDFCSGVARARNRYLRRRGRFWDNQQYGDLVLLDRDAIVRKLLYTWLNPVVAGLVRRAEEWPGAKILPRDWGKPRVVYPPQDGFYDPKKAQPVVFTPQPPPGFEHMTLEEVIEHFETLLREAEDRIARRRRRAGKKVRGRIWVLKQSPFACPKTPSRMMKLNPRFATRDGKLMARAKAMWTTFQRAYQACRKRWKEGYDVEFPAGTLKLRYTAPIRCRSPDALEPTVLGC